jgi:hypothetical protein
MVRIWAVRRAFADYVASEGCDCCKNAEKHDAAMKRLARLLDIPPYSDKSGYDIYRFKTGEKP